MKKIINNNASVGIEFTGSLSPSAASAEFVHHTVGTEANESLLAGLKILVEEEGNFTVEELLPEDCLEREAANSHSQIVNVIAYSASTVLGLIVLTPALSLASCFMLSRMYASSPVITSLKSWSCMMSVKAINAPIPDKVFVMILQVLQIQTGKYLS